MRLSTLCAVAAVALLPGIVASDDHAVEVPTVELPTTFDRVWYRGGKKGGSGGKRRTGDLTVTDEALEFSNPKGEVILPFASVRAVSMGRISGDVDTDWVVLAVGPAGATRVVSFRDGTKLGYGKRTEHIYSTIREALRSRRAGPYDAPEGFETYDKLANQFTLAVPRGWTAQHQSAVEVDGRLLWGRIVFSEQPLGSDRPPGPDRKAITLDRREALAGMTCNGFSRPAEGKLVEWVRQDPVFAAAWETIEDLRVEPFPLGDCIARRLHARVRDDTGEEIRLDVRAVSDDRTVFLFVLRSRPADHSEALARFDSSVASFEPSAVR